MNYFNYFTEIEGEFVKLRGSHMMVSPLDWTLIETWKNRGIPLHIVLRGIHSSFGGYDQRLNRGRKVNSLFFCQQEVEAMFQEYVESRVGSASGAAAIGQAGNGSTKNGHSASPFAPVTIIEFLKTQREGLLRMEQDDTDFREIIDRALERLSQIIEDSENSGAISLELLEMDLAMIEELIMDGLKKHAGEEKLSELRKEAGEKLRRYKQSMAKEVYEQTIVNFVAQRLRESYKIPRLSLFYL